MNLGNLPHAHVNDTLVPCFNDTPRPNGKRKRFLSKVLGGPELFGKVAVFAIASAMNL
jgi:hypothetical protein